MTDFQRLVTVTDSSNIDSIAYAIGDDIMRVAFNTGGTYEYEDVTPIQFGTIVASDSVGQTFNQLLNINVWPTKKVLR